MASTTPGSSTGSAAGSTAGAGTGIGAGTYNHAGNGPSADPAFDNKGPKALGTALHHVASSPFLAAPTSATTPQGDPETPPTPGSHDAPACEARRAAKRPAARGTAFYPRKRANTACQVCRARKTKCDNLKPSCSYCVSVGATCIQSPVDLSSFDPASLKILDRLDELERTIRSIVPAQSHDANLLPNVPELAISPDSSYRHAGTGKLDRVYNTSQGPLPLPLPRITPYASPGDTGDYAGLVPRLVQTDEAPQVASVLPQRVSHILQWLVFTESQRELSSVPQIPPADAISTPSDSSTTLAGLVDMQGSTRIYKLLDDFFLHIHCKNPILDETAAREMVLNAFLDGIDWSPASCLTMIVCALGSIATPFGPSLNTKPGTKAYKDSQVFFQAAQKRIGTLLVKSSIIGAQCLFLSGVYLMMTFQPIYAWRFFSQALAACQHFSFLAKAQSSPLSSVEMGRQDTQEQAVYWSAWKSERELRNELDLPDFDIIHSGSTLYPPFFPAPPAPSENSPNGPDAEAQRAREAWLFYLAEISLRRLTSRLSSEVLTLRQRHASSASFLDALSEMIPEYEAQTREWSDKLPADLSVQSPVEADGICRSVLRGRMVNLYEMIYWPFVMASISSHVTKRVLKPLASEYARKGLMTHMEQIHVNEPGFQHRHHGGIFMIRACTRSALVLTAAAKSGCTMPVHWRNSVQQVTDMLTFWEDEDHELSHWRTTLERELDMMKFG